MMFNAKNGSVKLLDTGMDYVCGGRGEMKRRILMRECLGFWTRIGE